MSFLSCRKAAGLTQAQVSEQIGVSTPAVSMWESGQNKPRADTLVELAKLYGCTVDDLLRPDQEG